jgi:hypothetical protein
MSGLWGRERERDLPRDENICLSSMHFFMAVFAESRRACASSSEKGPLSNSVRGLGFLAYKTEGT